MTDLTHSQLRNIDVLDYAHGARFRLTTGLLSAAAKTWNLWRQRSRERRELARASSYDLADIGFSVPQAKFEMNKPFWRE